MSIGHSINGAIDGPPGALASLDCSIPEKRRDPRDLNAKENQRNWFA
jgi:hypothetical protein